jgi:hypothetical protein
MLQANIQMAQFTLFIQQHYLGKEDWWMNLRIENYSH